jgi:hypothetical protein
VVTGTGGGPNFAGGRTFSGVKAGRRGFSAKTLRTCAVGHGARSGSGTQAPSPPTAGVQRCTEGPPHARTRSTRLWRCVGRVGGDAGLRALRNSWSKVGRVQLSQACPRADRVVRGYIYVLPLRLQVPSPLYCQLDDECPPPRPPAPPYAIFRVFRATVLAPRVF